MSEPGDLTPATSAGDGRGRAGIMIVATALAGALIGFGWTLHGHFLGDDFGYVGRFFELPFAEWPRLFVGSWAGNIWGFELRELRPVTGLAFMLDARIWAGNALGYRVTNLVLHVICAAMVGMLAWRGSNRSMGCGVAAAALFALHPVHSEPVHWITGRVDVLATTFYLGGVVAFVRYRSTGGHRWLVAIGLLYFLGAFSKEFGLMLPLMFLVADVTWLNAGRWQAARRWAPYVVCAGVVVIYYFCRRAAFGPGGMGTGPPQVGTYEFYEQLARRQLTYFCYFFQPSARWPHFGTALAIERPLRTFALIAIPAVLAFAGWRWAARWRPVEERRALMFFGLGWYVVATLPLIVTYISARHLYLASAGVCIALATVLHGVLRHRVAFGLVVVLLAGVFTQRLFVALKPWDAAAVTSKSISRALRALESEVRSGAALLLDVPELSDGAYVWTWAVPFALRPPFTRGRLDSKAVVLESRGLYVDWERWHDQPAVAALAHVTAPSWIVQASNQQELRRIAVPAEKVVAASTRFAVAPLKEHPHEAWRQLINDILEP